jgi:class 3 adenylate cyclase
MPLIAKKLLAPSSESLILILEDYLTAGDNRKNLEEKLLSEFCKPSVVMFTDISGFSSSTRDAGIVNSLAFVYQIQKQVALMIEKWNGDILKSMGDSLLVTFTTPKEAFLCSLEMLNFEKKITIGLGFGDVILLDGRDVFGDEVNRASSLAEDVGGPGQLLLSGQFYNSIKADHDVQVSRMDMGNWDAFEVLY